LHENYKLISKEREVDMNKADLIAQIAQDADITKVAAEKALNSFVLTVKESVRKSETVRLAGFGTYSIGQRAARKGRNPKTGQEINVPAKSVVKFKVSSSFSDYIR
jgi:DNA-binding protein HU-beta